MLLLENCKLWKLGNFSKLNIREVICHGMSPVMEKKSAKPTASLGLLLALGLALLGLRINEFCRWQRSLLNKLIHFV